MKLSITTTVALLLSTAVDCRAIDKRESVDLGGNEETFTQDIPVIHELEKRRGGGGGGGGGRGGGSSGGSGGGRSGSGGSSSGGSRGGSSSGGSGAAGSGSTRGSSRGSPRSGSYAGGARPFPPGQATGSGLRPSFVPATALAVFPGVLLLGAYVYAYDQHHHWVDQETHRNRSLPVECFCQQYMDCSCDDKSKDYAKGFDNGRPVNSSTVQDLTINGTEKIYVNGTVPNDTSSHGTSGASTLAPGQSMALNSGYWAMVAVVIGAVWM